MRPMPKVLACLVTLGLALPAAAQTMELQEPTPPRIFGFVAGGPSFPMSDAADRFSTGYGFNVGLGVNASRMLGVQAEAFWSHYGVDEGALNATDIDANSRMQYGTLEAVLRLGHGPFGAYVIGGGGVYYRRVEITEFLGSAVVPTCDPWLYYCYPTAVGVEQVLGARSSTDFGLNGGVGLTMRVAGGLKLFVEGRYHYIFGPEFEGGGESQRADGQYIPLMFGLRFE